MFFHLNESMDSVAESEQIAIFEVDHIFRTAKETLLEAREKRGRPLTDTKIITGWNGLMITAFASGYMVLHGKNYLSAATHAAEFLWANMWADSGCLLRIHKEGESKINGCLEDYAYFLEGLITLYEASLDRVWIERANQIADKMVDEFYDEESAGFFMTGRSAEVLVARLKNAADEAIPSANAIATLSLLKLGQFTGNKQYIATAEKSVQAFRQNIEENPVAYSGLLAAADFMESLVTEAVFVGSREQPAFEDMQGALHQDYRPNKIVLWNENEESSILLPPCRGKIFCRWKPGRLSVRERDLPSTHSNGESFGKPSSAATADSTQYF